MVFSKGVYKEDDSVRNEARHGWHEYSRRQELLSNISEIEKNFKQRNPYTLTMMSVKDNRGNHSNSIDVLPVSTKNEHYLCKESRLFLFCKQFQCLCQARDATSLSDDLVGWQPVVLLSFPLWFAESLEYYKYKY